MPDGHVMLPPDQLKNKKFCKFYNATSHSTNECRIFRQRIQRAIQQGRLKFDTPWKMKVDDNPFPEDQNMVDVGIFKGKTKVLTSAKSRKDGTVDPKMQISADEYREVKNVMIGRRANTSRGDVKGWSDEATSHISDPIE